jgi:acetyl-CoA C-acetyltransferase
MKNIKSWPIIIGAAQYTQPKEIRNPLDPLKLIAKVSKLAIEDTKITNLNEFIDSVYLVYFASWSYEDAPGELCEMLGIKPSIKILSSSGGNTSLRLLNQAALSITEGKSKVVLITGGEAWYSTSLARKGKIDLNWPDQKKSKYPEAGAMKSLNEFEQKYSLHIPSISYAIFETALRADSRRSLEDHQLHIGRLFEKFSKVASNNLFAWFKESYTAQEIITPTPKNRNVSHPYTKYMCSNPFVDQSGAILLTTQEFAEELNIEPSKWIYLMGGGDLQNIFNITQRPSLIKSPAVKYASRLSLAQAGLKIKDIDLFDFYSCFPSMVQIIRNTLKIKEEDPRALTITGGMPFFGGPWNNYSLHPVITAIDLIRRNPSLKIMQIANGGYNTKLSVGIYGKTPPKKPWSIDEFSEMQQEILKEELPKPVEEANGILTIEAYTIIYKRDGAPDFGIVLGLLENGSRTLARLKEDSKTLQKLSQQELVGREFSVFYDYETGFNYLKINN